MLIDQLVTEWENDCKIDESDIGHAAAISPNLHAKYLTHLVQYKLKLAKTGAELATLRSLKSKYFKGMLTTDELKELGWEAWQYRTLKTEVEELVDADKEVQKLVNREQYAKAAIYFLESVMKEISARSFHTRVAMDWVRFRAGN